MVTAIIAAAGRSRRMGSEINKLLIPLGGTPVLAHSLLTLSACPEVDKLIIVTSAEELPGLAALADRLALRPPCQMVEGGNERQFSVANALKEIPINEGIILVHDGARPLVTQKQISDVVEAAGRFRAAGLAAPVKDTIKTVDKEGFVTATPARSSLWSIQTPQAFEASLLKKAYHQAELDGFLGTDDASLVERLGIPVKLIEGGYENIKITTPEDICVAEALLTRRNGGEIASMRIGIGYDVHCLTQDRKLIIGGVDIPHHLGLEGHSDADVLLHAIKDALLGAAGMGDIGKMFPDTDASYKGASSLYLLEQVGNRLLAAGWRVNNIDATIVAQKPKLASHIPAMNKNVASTLKIAVESVNIKATTTEGLGFAGRQEGISAYAVASITRAF